MATDEPQNERQTTPRPPLEPVEMEPVPVMGVGPPWELFFVVRDWWRERKAKQQESQPSQ